jgi:putative transposase
MTMNHKKLYRIYREEGLSVKRRRGRKRARGTRTPMPSAPCANARWSLDFVSDSFGARRKFRILAVIDDCTRECLCLVADTSLSGARVARELSALIRLYESPKLTLGPVPLLLNDGDVRNIFPRLSIGIFFAWEAASCR